MLSISAMSSECERSFSGAKLTVTTIRNLLDADIVEAIVLNRWRKMEKRDQQRSEAEAFQRQRSLIVNT
jgi:hAT family C-terminal dimerisation region